MKTNIGAITAFATTCLAAIALIMQIDQHIDEAVYYGFLESIWRGALFGVTLTILTKLGFAYIDNLDDPSQVRPFTKGLLGRIPKMLATEGVKNEVNGKVFGGRGWKITLPKITADTAFQNSSYAPFRTTISTSDYDIEIEENRKDSDVVVRSKGENPIVERLNEHEALRVRQLVTAERINRMSRIMGCKSDIGQLTLHTAMRLRNNTTWNDIGGGITYLRLWHDSSWLYADGIGAVQLDDKILKHFIQKVKEERLSFIMSEAKLEPEAMPPMLGNVAAAKTIEIARRLVKRYPDMTDNIGTPIAPLVNEHLPRLVKRHTEAVEAAIAAKKTNPKELAAIAKEFEDGIDIIAGAVAEGLQRQQDQTRSDLSVEIAFLRDRHPERAFAPACPA